MEPVTIDEDDFETLNEKIPFVIAKLNDLKDAIKKGDMDRVKSNTDFLDKYLFSEKELVSELQKNVKCVTDMDLILSACSHKQTHILHYLLYETQILDLLNNVSIDINQVDNQRATAFVSAINSDDFNMVEMLYDYWSGDTYWLGHHDAIYVINNIQRLGNLLEHARSSCLQRLIHKQQMLVNIRCLITFNSFQRDLYDNIHKLKPKINLLNETMNKAKVVGTMLLNVLRIYDKYSNLDIVRIPNSTYEHEQMLKNMFDDKSSVYYKGLAYIMYEVYFRKLDLNISLLIIENINVLRCHFKKRFNVKKTKASSSKNNVSDSNVVSPPKTNTWYKHAAQLYEDIESTLYHFIYRTSEDWRLYIPKNRQQSVKKNRLGIHEGQFCNLELKFDEHKVYSGPVIFFERKNFKKHVKKLKKVLKNHVISEKSYKKLQNQKNVPHAKHTQDEKDLLDDNYLKPIKYMRDHYSLRKIAYYLEALENGGQFDVLTIERVLQVIGEMLKCSDDSYHLSPSVKALLQTELSVETIKHLHNIREYLSHVHKGQLGRRIQVSNVDTQIFFKVQQDLKEILQRIYPILDIFRAILDKSLLDSGLHLLETRIQKFPDVDVTDQLLKEITWVIGNRDELLMKRTLACSQVTDLIAAVLPKHINIMNETLRLIIKNNENWDSIKNELCKYKITKIPNYPEVNQITDLTNKLDKYMKRNKNKDEDVLDRLGQMQDLSIHWISIKHLLEFLSDELDFAMFKDIGILLKSGLKDKLPDLQAVNNIQKILDEINIWCHSRQQNCVPSTIPFLNTNKYIFDGITELDKNIYIIEKDIKEVPYSTQRDQLLICLLDRIGLLKKTLQYSKRIPMSQQLCKYKRDQGFQCMLEMLLVDIGNILAHCKVRLMNKSAKLLTGINLGNVLDHGNPFLDVISFVLDSNDFSSELLSKAMMFAEDEESIRALYKLFKDNVKYETIKLSDKAAMNDDQKIFLDQFKMCNRWESYLNLIPK